MSFNSIFGPSVIILAIFSLLLGIIFKINILILISGYLGIFAGMVMFFWTLFSGAYIGTILAPIMWTCFVSLIFLGLSLIFPPLNIIMINSFNNYSLKVLYAYLIILILGYIHIFTGV